MASVECLAVGTAHVVSARPIRICHVMSADLWAGAEVQVATAASFLADQSGVELSAVLFNDGWLASQLRGLGVPVVVFDEHTCSPARILAMLIRYLKMHEIDVVHTHRHKDSVLGTIAARLAGVPHLVRTVHGLSEPMRGWDRLKQNVYDAVDRTALRLFADRIVAVSEQIAGLLRRAGHRTVLRVHNGIDVRHVAATRPAADVRSILGIRPGQLLIGTAGRFNAVKGQQYLLEAARLLDDRLDARVLFVGSGPLETELRTQASELGVMERCLFVDPAVDSRAGIYDLIAAMDVFTLPSLSEGIPMAMLEAMALGRPVVASEVGGIPEVITDRVNGLLVPACDPRAIADACAALAADRARAEALGSRAREVVEQRFSRERNGQSLLRMYHDLGRHNRVASALTADALVGAVLRTAVQRGRRVVDLFRERRRAEAVRRDPAAVIALLQRATRVLVVCHGNIIRSAFAASLIERALGAETGLAISSAGLEATPGREADPTAVDVARRFGIDLTTHAATRLTPALAAAADAIFVMEVPQLADVCARFPEARRKTFLFSCLSPEAPLEIADPYDCDQAVFERRFDEIAGAAYSLIRALSDRAS